ncbi:uncharacterized protein METZ01_LOCUS447446, partial [marine metagenome]
MVLVTFTAPDVTSTLPSTKKRFGMLWA